MLPVSYLPECKLPKLPELPELLVAGQPLEPTPSSQPSATMLTREVDSTTIVGWLQAFDIPHSALWFGAGSFIILSVSFMPRMWCGLVEIGVNCALFYLAAVFFCCTFLPGSGALFCQGNSNDSSITESDVVRWIHVYLPALNLALEKARQVFSGDPVTTLKAAAGLWLLASAGSMMSLWSLACLCQSVAVQAWMAWDAYPHKKAVLIAAFLLVWNISSFSTRLWGGFVIFVWLRLNQQSNPFAFQGAVSDVSCRTTIDLSNHQRILQHAKGAQKSVECSGVQGDSAGMKTEQTQLSPGKREVKGSLIYKA